MNTIKNKMIARRVSKGFNEADSIKMLDELIEAHSGDNLETALVYEGFATEAQAYVFVNVRNNK